jgi:uncharacterized protein (TIGR02265 family)
MADKLIFAQAVEGLLLALRPIDQATAERLRGCGIDVEKPLRTAYPLEAFCAALDVAAEAIAPGVDSLAACEQVGRRFMDAYEQTMVGRAMVAVMRVIGPWRTLEPLSRQFRTGNNFSETALTRLGPTEAELWCNEVTRPGWYVGVVGRGLELAGATDVHVTVISHGHDGGRFLVRWA